jgi:hypothetical protein
MNYFRLWFFLSIALLLLGFLFPVLFGYSGDHQ